MLRRCLLLCALTLGLALPSWALDAPSGKVLVTFSGKISHKNQGKLAVLDAQLLDKLPWVEIRTSTPWYPGVSVFRGPRLQDVLQLVGAQGQTLEIKALNDYITTVPLADAAEWQPILARMHNGKPLQARDKGPLFLVYPYDSNKKLQSELYYSRSAWQINKIAVK
ncbi:molybdopterin-dependent oxidoreductase [Chitinibacter sp. ZOR0017]|uniref:molybdopterin-dependent oxidoreductase n=1 Tax=Chitinibacter sp. ZOR0017 TaxID=1339254 RepID=UPI000647B95F|nr:molybdopterin-dependent oxidoreductase [Chitinibacter sp. ZOR0017]